MKVEVIYALPEEQKSFFVESESSLTVKQVIEQSKITHVYQDLKEIDNLTVGIYGKIVGLDDFIKDKDRIEIYRELTIDPKQARILRAEQKRKKEGIKPFGS